MAKPTCHTPAMRLGLRLLLQRSRGHGMSPPPPRHRNLHGRPCHSPHRSGLLLLVCHRDTSQTLPTHPHRSGLLLLVCHRERRVDDRRRQRLPDAADRHVAFVRAERLVLDAIRPASK